MTIDSCRDRFLEYLQFEKRFSAHTLVAYQTDIEQFSIYLNSMYQITSIEEVNHTLIRSWIVEMMDQGISPRSVNRKITTMKTFYKFLLRQQWVSENPMLKIQSPKTSKRLPVFVEKEKMDVLLDQVAFGADLKGLRDKLIIELFYSTGMRLSELIQLKEKEVDLYSNQLKVLGKRNKERLIPITNELKVQLQHYLKERPISSEEVLLLSDRGKKLSEKFVYNLVKAYLSQVTTIDKKSPHVLRHTFATHMLNNGADLNAIKELLGHANLSATQVYTHNTVEKLKNVHKQAHPKA